MELDLKQAFSWYPSVIHEIVSHMRQRVYAYRSLGRILGAMRKLVCLCVMVLTGSAFAGEPDYGKVVQPLLAEHCYACHGPDEKTREAGLRFDQRESATSILESGEHAIVPGDPMGSEMIRRLISKDPDVMMPPPDVKKRPTAEAKSVLQEWIAEGAVYAQHWAFELVRKPPLPEVEDMAWPRNSIDRFILARLEKEGMKPSPRADLATLVRRLSLDLRGIPPSAHELDEFANADDEDAAYRRAIGAMIESPHYGERMAQDWLDLARYGDTNGYHSDSNRDMWLYRDYVIDSFNRNKRFDRFIVENMAGDLLPEATDETRVASGFNRCVTFNEEGGADPDEFYVTYAVDRANTTGQVFLGLTVGCAQCHDHKYDPISQKEFYQLYAFFNSVDGEIGAGGMSGFHNKPLPPLLRVKTPAVAERITALDRQIEKVQESLVDARNRPAYSDPGGSLGAAAWTWAASLNKEVPAGLRVTEGLQLHLDAANVVIDPLGTVQTWSDGSGNARHASATGAPKRIPDGLGGRPVVRLDGKSDFLRTVSGAEVLGGDFTMIAVLRFHEMRAHQMALMWGEESKGKRRALWKTDKNKLSFNGYAADVVGTADFRIDEAAIAVVTQEGPNNKTRFYLDGESGGEGSVKLSDYAGGAITIGANNAGLEKTAADFAEILVYDRALDESELSKVGRWLGAKFGIDTTYEAAPKEIMAIAAKAEGHRTPEERQKLFDHFIAHEHAESRELFHLLDGELKALKEQRNDAEKTVPTTMVMVEMKKRKPAYVLARGDFQQPGEEVQPDVPAIFPRLSSDYPRNRLGLAHWLIDPKHPLVARVTVNRLWKQLFGSGLVKTLGDFGTQGERPSHPELLDWLAADFIEHGWDVKRMQRQMLESSTYRQSSAVHGRYNEVDPDNRLLSRASRFRLSAEEVRDVSLAVSGLLNPELGGPSVMPPQPPGYLSSIGKQWNDSNGNARHRRGLYTFWRRTMLYPTFQIFDAPSREFCAVNRPRTNTPLQALVTLNDPAFVEAARAFGNRILLEGGVDDKSRLTFAFRAATSRNPTKLELAVLKRALDEQRREFADDMDAAGRLLAEQTAKSGNAGERAGWTAVANIILNLDETITRE